MHKNSPKTTISMTFFINHLVSIHNPKNGAVERQNKHLHLFHMKVSKQF